MRFATQHSIELLLAQPAENRIGILYDAHPIDYFGPDAIALDRDLTSARPRGGAAGDFDGDGELDLAVGFHGSPGLIVHLGMGSGTPRASRVLDGTGGIAAVASGDLDGDGIADVVAHTVSRRDRVGPGRPGRDAWSCERRSAVGLPYPPCCSWAMSTACRATRSS